MASATESAPSTDGTYACPDCSEVFDNHRALNAHSAKHKREREGQRFSPKALAQEALRELLAPLREQLAEVNAEIDERTRDLQELREARTMIEKALRQLDPNASTPKSKTAAANGAAGVASASLDRKVATLRALTQEHPELFEEGVTANALADYWQSNDLQPAASLSSIRKGFEQLRDEGIMRADRVVKGGGMAWKLVNNGGISHGS